MKILLCVDNSEVSKKAVEKAFQIIQKDSEVTIFTVVDDFFMESNPTWEIFGTGPLMSYEEKMALLERGKTIGEKLLKEVAEKTSHAGFRNVSSKLVHGTPRQMICDECQEGKYDVVCVGARGLGKIQKILLGSTSDYVVSHCACTVVVVK